MRIRELRHLAGLTQQAVADSVGVRHTAVVAWEKGSKNPSADKLPKLAATLGCSIDDLFSRDPPNGEIAS